MIEYFISIYQYIDSSSIISCEVDKHFVTMLRSSYCYKHKSCSGFYNVQGMSYLTRQISRSLQQFYTKEKTSNKQMCFQFLTYQITLFEYTVTYKATLISLFYIFNLFPPYRFTRNLRICKCNFMATVKSELYLLLMPLKPDPFLTLSNNLLRLILRIVKYKLKCCEYIKKLQTCTN